jgi:beta-phosphoglucomutase
MPCYSLGVNERLAFIFDLDGVLVNSMPLHMVAWERYLEKLGIEVEDLERRMHGRRNEELVNDLIGSDLPADRVFAHGAAKEQLWRDLLLEDGIDRYRIPGLTEFLERHIDVPKAIASNAEPQNIEFVLHHYGLRRFFDIAVNGLEVARPKPFPDVYLEAGRRLNREPVECIVFEDSPTGLQAAIAAGMRVVGVETTSNDLDKADLCVKDFADARLEEWLTQEAQFRRPA